jgi:hypothetical protein
MKPDNNNDNNSNSNSSYHHPKLARIYIDRTADVDSLTAQLRSIQSAIPSDPFACLQIRGIYNLISVITGIDRSHVSRILRRYTGYKSDTLSKIATCLNVTVPQLEQYIQSQPVPKYKNLRQSLSDSDIEVIRTSSESSRVLATKHKMSRQTVCNIRNTR